MEALDDVRRALRQLEPRFALLNDPIRNRMLVAEEEYASNAVATSNYTAATFVILTLYELFRIPTNAFFLLIAFIQADELQNNRPYRSERLSWQELLIGQIVRVHNNRELSAEIVILATSEEEGRRFTDTCNLDDDTGLKRRVAMQSIANIAGWRKMNAPALVESTVCAAASTLKGRFKYEQPSSELYEFTGHGS
uniref:P-type ATPase N-terminal domain-containing protein n=1 Tax=Globisporangium ultimum (strain ATCC 200006 / CBS 805.95 / DAOM BR144) TaxID=431595 RepID=K3WTB6_GLOUD